MRSAESKYKIFFPGEENSNEFYLSEDSDSDDQEETVLE